MKKRIGIVFLLILSFSISKAQNIQLHYDYGNGVYKNSPARNYYTGTFEMFKPDSLGSTFMFIDFDFNGENSSPTLAYVEISRDFKFGKLPVQAHIEYNGGLVNSFSFDNAYLLGVSYPFKLGSASLSGMLAYKNIANTTEGVDIQFTTAWFAMFFKGKLTFSGFLDIWTQDETLNGLKDGKKFVLLAEPQLWFNINKAFSIGGELEISNNFIFGTDNIEFYPTFAIKWNI